MNSRIAALLGVVALGATSCDETPVGPEVVAPTHPTIDTVRVLFDSVGREFFVEASVTPGSSGEAVDTVVFEARRPDGADTTGLLFDDGTHGDIIFGDGRFTTKTDSSFARRIDGSFDFAVRASDAAGAESQPVSIVFLVTPEGPPEIILSNVTNDIVVGDTIVIELLATDPQGLDDIRRVTYDVRAPDSSIIRDPTFAFRDDGQFGDLHPNDGIYTVHQPTNPQGETGIFTFLVTAQDRAGLESDLLEIPVLLAAP